MRVPSLLLLAAVTLSLGFAPVPPPKAKKPKPGAADLKALEGTWTVVSYEVGRAKPKGKALAVRPPAKTTYQTVEIKDGQWVQKRTLAKGTTSQTAPYAILLDASKDPPTFDMGPARSAVKGKAKAKAPAVNVTRRGLVRLEGDQLTVVYSMSGKDRPASVDAELSTSQYRWVLKREKR